MFNSQLPPLSDLPTSRQLVRATLLAGAVASALLVTVILPSEYGLDPTGAGRLLGLTQMGEIKAQLAREADADRAVEAGKPIVAEVKDSIEPATSAPSAPAGQRSDLTEVVLKPGQGAEIKVAAVEGAQIAYDWSVRGGVVNYDTHADAVGISYHGYGKGNGSAGEKGTLVAAFDGKHGWFWRNRTGQTVTVILQTNGNYTEIKRVV